MVKRSGNREAKKPKQIRDKPTAARSVAELASTVRKPRRQ